MPTVGYDWSTDRLKSDLKSTSDSRGKSSLPGKSQKYTHTSKAIHTFTVHDTLVNFKH